MGYNLLSFLKFVIDRDFFMFMAGMAFTLGCDESRASVAAGFFVAALILTITAKGPGRVFQIERGIQALPD